MPWTKKDAREKNRKATGRLGEIWAEVANRELKKHGDEGRAIRVANAVVNRALGKGGKEKSGK